MYQVGKREHKHRKLLKRTAWLVSLLLVRSRSSTVYSHLKSHPLKMCITQPLSVRRTMPDSTENNR